MITTLISSFVTGGVVALITWFISLKTIEGSNKKTIGTAEERAKEIVENAQLKADTIYKEAEISAKESALQLKKDMENEVKEQRNEVQQYEKRVIAKEEAIDKKFDAIEERTTELAKKEEQLALEEDRIEEIKQKQAEGPIKGNEGSNVINGLNLLLSSFYNTRSPGCGSPVSSDLRNARRSGLWCACRK